MSRLTYVTETAEQHLQLERRPNPSLEFHVDIQPVLTAISSMQLLQMKGVRLV